MRVVPVGHEPPGHESRSAGRTASSDAGSEEASATGVLLALGQIVPLKFREQSIDGTSLPLLTEDHLTVYMGMRLGPALKLRTSLAKLTGRCTVCMHCIHCHGEDNDRRSTSSASSTPATGGSTGCAPLPASSTPPMVPPAATPPANVSASSPATSK
ncbi:hypothetical protein IscW_ISCW021381 [Ixodes scapularis]|uniref:Uncharacterized protein n=1 Tax=Ixodes scapularis TaxID=6945 RepID=B7Q8C4_IXOSC|nr:hypothetical protein IscW_ISCW021381 [Ixodes scapularis]|eukprot:XP_002412340.1 hypothetical protein IscW_ISCW021381 [Ixodes scapularis]